MFKRIGATLIAALLALPAAAQDVTPAFLEQPGKIWVSSDLPLAVTQGLLVPLIPYARFQDGQIETGFLSRLGSIYASTCASPMNCTSITTMGATRQGPYSLAAGKLTTDAPRRTDWHFDRDDTGTVAAVAASDFLTGDTAHLTREGDLLIQRRVEGLRVYAALTTDEMWDAQNLPVLFDQSIIQTYACAVDQLTRFRQKDPDTWDFEDQSFAALIRQARLVSNIDMEIKRLEPPAAYDNPDLLSPETKAQVADKTLLRTAHSLTLSFFQRELINGSPDGVTPLHPDSIAEKVWADVDPVLDRFFQRSDDAAALRMTFERQATDLPQAAYVISRYAMVAATGKDAFKTMFCP